LRLPKRHTPARWWSGVSPFRRMNGGACKFCIVAGTVNYRVTLGPNVVTTSLRVVATILRAVGTILRAGLTTLHALLQPRPTTAVPGSTAAEAPELLSDVPPELLSIILSQLETLDLAALAATCSSLWCDAPTPVETELRQRATARGIRVASSLPEEAVAWMPYLLKRLRVAQRQQAPLAAAGEGHSIFVDTEGRLHLTCRHEDIQTGKVGEPFLGYDCGSVLTRANREASSDIVMSVPPTLVPSMQDKCIVSVASGGNHCLMLSAVGEVYSSGGNTHGALGHADGNTGAGLRRVETLEASAEGNRRLKVLVQPATRFVHCAPPRYHKLREDLRRGRDVSCDPSLRGVCVVRQ